ncbi:MAG TPA: FGGY family carbohydrate kinase [Prolixibacteraceae bacterium]|nr:FGGY family carbohydrate kinase [Prolixibacteraceae bacterium]
MYLLGFDIGSSSVKVSLLQGDNGECLASAFSPRQEMSISARVAGWAEQDPEGWWHHLKLALKEVLTVSGIDSGAIGAVGISYQMHGLVMVDKNHQVIRPSIIWCDSRAAGIGEAAFRSIGGEKCLSHLLNSPGNFTASKLRWVKENEPDSYHRLYKIMLPGDYIAMKMSGEIRTTVTGLSEGILWDFSENSPAKLLLRHYGFDESMIPELVPVFGEQGRISASAAAELGLREGTLIAYRAGDQPNNALSLNVLQPGEVATTAGTSGVVYGVSGEIRFDPDSRVNTFAHVNHSAAKPRLGVLLCINGTGILNSWLKKTTGNLYSYDEMNRIAGEIPVGSGGVTILPFGNGAERVLKNRDIGASVSGLNFNMHHTGHLLRAAQEGIVFSFKYGMDVMESTGIHPRVIRAGKANMFLSPVFRETLAGITGATIELYNTDGSIGAARGAGIGSGYYASPDEAFRNLVKLETVEPDSAKTGQYMEAYEQWLSHLNSVINH